MFSPFQPKNLAAIAGAIGACALSSCTLPPEQAWRKIKSDGLIAYWSYELASPYAESHQKAQSSAPSGRLVSGPQLAQSRMTPTPISPINQPGMMSTGKALTAQSIPSLPGFVRSPYTNPPRLVDVKGSAPGTTMICPYTQRPFIVPNDFIDAPGSALASTAPSSVAPESKAEPTKRPVPATGTNETLPKVVMNDRPTEPSAPSQAKTSPAPVPSAPATTPLSTVAPQPPTLAPKPVQEIPFGTAITGRPGFVNSPFAAKHQLVDVTGLPTGMEVKCPYTGKLFRVPPQDVASSKPSETAPLASPEEPKKK